MLTLYQQLIKNDILIAQEWNKKIVALTKKYFEQKLDKAVKTDGVVDCPEHSK